MSANEWIDEYGLGALMLFNVSMVALWGVIELLKYAAPLLMQ